MAKSIKTTQSEEPLLWQTIITDPVAKRVLENPILAAKEAIDAAIDAAGYAKASA